MSENKTQATGASVMQFLDAVPHQGRREDGFSMLDLMKRATGMEPAMWGDSLVGFGWYHYKYDSGREGDFFLTGFSPRKANLVVYIVPGFKPYGNELARLGRHKHSVSCLYLGRLSSVDLVVLETMVSDSVARMKRTYPDWKPQPSTA